jgi:hypothetical protein
MFALLFGGIQFGYAFYTYNNLAKAVSDGARYGSMHTYSGLCASTCNSDSTFVTDVQNVVLYGNSSPSGSPNPVVHNLASSNVTVTVAAVNNVPTTIAVAITGYSMSLPLSTVALTNKPAAMFPFVGRYAHP